jgi:hypothetical protein
MDYEVEQHGDWTYRKWSDGTEQWAFNDEREVYVERVMRPDSRRKRWALVSRHDPDSEDRYNNCLYPPKISGPFPTLEAARVAYLVYVETMEAA